MRVLVPAALLALASFCPAYADDGAMGQLENATNGHQTLEQTYGDSQKGEKCPEACPDGGSTNVPEPPPPKPADKDDNG